VSCSQMKTVSHAAVILTVFSEGTLGCSLPAFASVSHHGRYFLKTHCPLPQHARGCWECFLPHQLFQGLGCWTMVNVDVVHYVLLAMVHTTVGYRSQSLHWGLDDYLIMQMSSAPAIPFHPAQPLKCFQQRFVKS
jgi:hypothetical protein